MTSVLLPTGGEAEPFAYHYYSHLEDALEAAGAADTLDLPFVLHSRELEDPDADGESTTLTKEYVLVLLSPGTAFEFPSGDAAAE